MLKVSDLRCKFIFVGRFLCLQLLYIGLLLLDNFAELVLDLFKLYCLRLKFAIQIIVELACNTLVVCFALLGLINLSDLRPHFILQPRQLCYHIVHEVSFASVRFTEDPEQADLFEDWALLLIHREAVLRRHCPQGCMLG